MSLTIWTFCKSFGSSWRRKADLDVQQVRLEAKGTFCVCFSCKDAVLMSVCSTPFHIWTEENLRERNLYLRTNKILKSTESTRILFNSSESSLEGQRARVINHMQHATLFISFIFIVNLRVLSHIMVNSWISLRNIKRVPWDRVCNGLMVKDANGSRTAKQF